MRYTLILLVLCGLGCASQQGDERNQPEPSQPWWHDTKSTQQFYADSSECEVAANQATAGQRIPLGSAVHEAIIQAKLRQNAYQRCMWGEGWYQAARKRDRR